MTDSEAVRLGRIALGGLCFAALGFVKLWLDERKAERLNRQILAAIKANSDRQYPKRPSQRTKIQVVRRWLKMRGSR